MKLVRANIENITSTHKKSWKIVDTNVWAALHRKIRTEVEEKVDDQLWVHVYDDLTETVH